MGKRKNARNVNREQNLKQATKRRNASKSTAVGAYAKSDDFDGNPNDEVDNFELDKDQIFLDKSQRATVPSDSEEEVYSLKGDSSEEDDEDLDVDEFEDEAENDLEEEVIDVSDGIEEMDSDLEGNRRYQEEDLGTLRASKSWGTKSVAFYGSDYQRQKKRTRQEADDLEDEEEIAAMAHKRDLMNHFDETDFQVDAFETSQNEDQLHANDESSVKVQATLVTKEEKLSNLKLRHPELEDLVEECNSLNDELTKELVPKLKKLASKSEDSLSEWDKLVQLKFAVYSHYLMCLCVYFMLTQNKQPTENHPVMEKLLHFRKYISKLDQFEIKLADKPKKWTRKASKSDRVPLETGENGDEFDEHGALDVYEQVKKYQEGKKESAKAKREALVEEEKEKRESAKKRKIEIESKSLVEKDGVSKRSVTKPMSKNRSVTEVRYMQSKRTKNPRTRNRKKSIVANVRRKGQVRPMRDASVNYAGETTGINVQAKRGTKLS